MTDTPKTVTRTIDYAQDVRSAVEEWVKKHDSPYLKSSVHRQLDASLQANVAKLLGFEKRSGSNWEIDHCNGRAGNSVIGKMIGDMAREACESWAKSVVDDMPEFPEELRKAAEDEYVATFRREMSAHIRSAAKKRAAEIADSIVQDAATVDMLTAEIEEAVTVDEDDADAWGRPIS